MFRSKSGGAVLFVPFDLFVAAWKSRQIWVVQILENNENSRFESDATSTLKDYEFEQMMTLFAAHSTCGEDHESLKIGTRRNLNLIFGREASKSLTISSQPRI